MATDGAKKEQLKIEEAKEEEHKNIFGEDQPNQDNEKNLLLSSPLFKDTNLQKSLHTIIST